MDTVKYTIHFFSLALGLGTFFFSPIVSTRLTGAGFLKLVITVLIGCLTLSFCVGYFIDPFFTVYSSILYGVSLLLAISIYKLHNDTATLLMKVSRGVLALTLLALSYSLDRSFLGWSYFLLTTLFIGICHYTMVLGHYYLVVPKLTEKPLLISLKIFWAVLVLKMIVASLSVSEHADFLVSGSQEGFGYMFNWIVISMRFLWGFLALGILSYFGYRLSAMRSIQSATGVFYIMVFFIFTGELIAIYTFFQTGIYL